MKCRIVSILAHNERYVAAEPDGSVTATRTKMGPWETFAEVTLDDGRVMLVTHDGRMLYDDRVNGRITARVLPYCAISNRTLFRLEQRGAIRTSWGHYVTADTGDEPRLRTDATEIGPWERFVIYDHADPARIWNSREGNGNE